MTVAFDTRKKFINKIPGVIHPADKTTRPQMLKKNINPDYHDLIKEFYKITNIPLLLNTSFNLNGEPVVMTPEDALRTFYSCGLDILVLNDYVIYK